MKKAFLISSLLGVAAISSAYWWWHSDEPETSDGEGRPAVRKLLPEEDSFNPLVLDNIREKLTRKPKARMHRKKPITGYRELNAAYRKVQVRVYNPTATALTASLWDVAVEPDKQQVFGEQASLSLDHATHIHVQAMAWNPANGCTYVVSQLSNRVTVLSAEREVVASIILDDRFPGVSSPVSIAVNTREESTHYGYVYVGNSVADTLSVLSPEHRLIETLQPGTRPVSLAYNPVNNKLYAANLVDDRVAVFDGETHQVESPLSIGIQQPELVSINTSNGSIYVANGDQSLSIFEADHSPVNTVNLSFQLDDILFHPDQNALLLSTDQELWALDADTLELQALSLSLGGHMGYNPAVNQVYINSQDGLLSLLDSTLKVTESISAGLQSPALAFDERQELLIAFNAGQSTLHWFGAGTQGLIHDEDYLEKRENFQHNPALVKHVRLVSTGGNLPPTVLNLNSRSVSGKRHLQPLSLNNFRSPQHFQEVFEITALKESLIDGKTGWQFKVQPGQAITILIYYRQVKLRDLMPERSRPSIPIV